MCLLPLFAERPRSHSYYLVKCVRWRCENSVVMFALCAVCILSLARFPPTPLPWLLLCGGAARPAVSCQPGCGKRPRGQRVGPDSGLGATGGPRAPWADVCAPTSTPRLSTMALCTTGKGRVGDVGLRRQWVRQREGDRKHDQEVARICRYHVEKRHRHK